MAVNSNLKIEPRPSVEDDVAELSALLPITLHDLKSAVPAPMPMREAMRPPRWSNREANAPIKYLKQAPVSWFHFIAGNYDPRVQYIESSACARVARLGPVKDL